MADLQQFLDYYMPKKAWTGTGISNADHPAWATLGYDGGLGVLDNRDSMSQTYSDPWLSQATSSGVPYSWLKDRASMLNDYDPSFFTSGGGEGEAAMRNNFSKYGLSYSNLIPQAGNADFWNSAAGKNYYDVWENTGNQVAASQDNGDDGLGGLGGLLGGLAGIALAPLTGGSSLWMGALGGGLGSAATGGNPLTGALLGGLGGWGWNALGGLGGIGGLSQDAMLAAQAAGFSPAELAAWQGAGSAGGMSGLGFGSGVGGNSMGLLDYLPGADTIGGSWGSSIPDLYSSLGSSGGWGSQIGTIGSGLEGAVGTYSDPGLWDSISSYFGGSNSSLTNAAKAILGGGGGSGGSGSLLGALLGGTLGGIGGSQEAGKITTVQEPWSAQQPYLTDLFARSKEASLQNTAPGMYETNAVNALNSAALGPTSNPMLGMDNPYLNKTIQTAQDDVTRNMQNQFNTANRQSGSFGNSGLQETYARELPKALGNIDTSMRMQDYTNQQGLYENAANRNLSSAQNLYGMGQNYRYTPYNNLNQYGNLIRGSYGSSTSQPYFNNPTASILGGASAGYKLFGG
jgi:hypothetical protein